MMLLEVTGGYFGARGIGYTGFRYFAPSGSSLGAASIAENPGVRRKDFGNVTSPTQKAPDTIMFLKSSCSYEFDRGS